MPGGRVANGRCPGSAGDIRCARSLSELSITRTGSYTRRFLRGRTPLCGIGVTSRIEVI